MRTVMMPRERKTKKDNERERERENGCDTAVSAVVFSV